MTQTIGAMNLINATIDASANGASWTDISGSTNKVVPSPQTADTGAIATLSGDYKIVTAGKFEPVEVNVTIVYTEKTGEGYKFFATQNAVAGRPIYLRWSPGGGGAGFDRFFLSDANGDYAAGVISQFAYPGADADTPGPAVVEMVVRATKISSEMIGSPSASLSPSASAS